MNAKTRHIHDNYNVVQYKYKLVRVYIVSACLYIFTLLIDNWDIVWLSLVWTSLLEVWQLRQLLETAISVIPDLTLIHHTSLDGSKNKKKTV